MVDEAGNDDEPGLPAIREPFPFVIVRDRVSHIFYWGAIIPVFFILAKNFNIGFISAEIAKKVAVTLAWLWPVLPGNYEIIRNAATSAEANNYVLFFVSVLLFGLFVAVYACAQYKKYRETMKRPDPVLDPAVIGCGIFLYLVFSRYDIISIDKIGFHYLSQYMLMSALLFSSVVLIVSAIRLCDFSAGKRRPM